MRIDVGILEAVGGSGWVEKSCKLTSKHRKRKVAIVTFPAREKRERGRERRGLRSRFFYCMGGKQRICRGWMYLLTKGKVTFELDFLGSDELVSIASLPVLRFSRLEKRGACWPRRTPHPPSLRSFTTHTLLSPFSSPSPSTAPKTASSSFPIPLHTRPPVHLVVPGGGGQFVIPLLPKG